jgi:tetratricopeptide (TPR) repeat protein
MATEVYYECCGKSICGGCIHSFSKSGNDEKCPFCKAERMDKTDEEKVEEMMKRAAVNDAGAMSALADCYYLGEHGLLQDRDKALELWKQAAALGSSHAHFSLALIYDEGGDIKKVKFHFETAAMAGHEVARCNLGILEGKSQNMEQAVKHWTTAASAGDYDAMNFILLAFNEGLVSRDSIDSTLIAYNNSCVEMRSEARDDYIRVAMEMNEST